MSRNRVNQSYMANKSIDQSINHEVKYMGPPTKARSLLPEPIPITPSFGITELDSLLISKHFKNRGSMKNCLPGIKVAVKLY